jgi:hypothetical protein
MSCHQVSNIRTDQSSLYQQAREGPKLCCALSMGFLYTNLSVVVMRKARMQQLPEYVVTGALGVPNQGTQPPSQVHVDSCYLLRGWELKAESSSRFTSLRGLLCSF